MHSTRQSSLLNVYIETLIPPAILHNSHPPRKRAIESNPTMHRIEYDRIELHPPSLQPCLHKRDVKRTIVSHPRMEEPLGHILQNAFKSPAGLEYKFAFLNGWEPIRHDGQEPTHAALPPKLAPKPHTDAAPPRLWCATALTAVSPLRSVSSGHTYYLRAPPVPLLNSYCVLGLEDAVAVAADGTHPLSIAACWNRVPARTLVSYGYSSW